MGPAFAETASEASDPVAVPTKEGTTEATDGALIGESGRNGIATQPPYSAIISLWPARICAVRAFPSTAARGVTGGKGGTRVGGCAEASALGWPNRGPRMRWTGGGPLCRASDCPGQLCDSRCTPSRMVLFGELGHERRPLVPDHSSSLRRHMSRRKRRCWPFGLASGGGSSFR